MKVAVIIDAWFPFIGGGQINAWEISSRIASKENQIDIITRNNGQDNLAPQKNLRVYKLGPKAAADDMFSKSLFIIRSFFFISRRDYDLIHAHAFLPGIAARLLMVFKGIPAIFTVHGTSINTKLNNLFARWLEKFILTKIRYTAQITVSRDFLKTKNINRKVIYVPNGVNVSQFDKIKTIKAKDPSIIFVGRLHPQKNLPLLISAINLVKKNMPNIRLLIVGDGPQKDFLKALVKESHLEKNVKLIGPSTRSDLVRLYKSSHLFILPSIYEGQPLTLLEAWAAKLPVIVTRTGDCQFLIKNDYNGYLIENQNDYHEITWAIIKAFKNKNLEKLGQNGYNLVKKNFSWDKSAEQILNMYEQIAYN